MLFWFIDFKKYGYSVVGKHFAMGGPGLMWENIDMAPVRRDNPALEALRFKSWGGDYVDLYDVYTYYHGKWPWNNVVNIIRDITGLHYYRSGKISHILTYAITCVYFKFLIFLSAWQVLQNFLLLKSNPQFFEMWMRVKYGPEPTCDWSGQDWRLVHLTGGGEGDSCVNLNVNATAWGIRELDNYEEFNPPYHGYEGTKPCPTVKCNLHFYEKDNCMGDLVMTQDYINRASTAYDGCHIGPFENLLGMHHDTFRSVRPVCCAGPFCEVLHPQACEFETLARDEQRFAELKQAGIIPPEYPPPPPPAAIRSTHGGNTNCSTGLISTSGWTEGALRRVGGDHMPVAARSHIDPVWFEHYEDWCQEQVNSPNLGPR